MPPRRRPRRRQASVTAYFSTATDREPPEREPLCKPEPQAVLPSLRKKPLLPGKDLAEPKYTPSPPSPPSSTAPSPPLLAEASVTLSPPSSPSIADEAQEVHHEDAAGAPMPASVSAAVAAGDINTAPDKEPSSPVLRWEMGAPLTGCDVAPSLAILSLCTPFAGLVLPHGEAALASPVTPENWRPRVDGKPGLVPCAAVASQPGADMPSTNASVPSRLSRRRNLARRAAAQTQGTGQAAKLSVAVVKHAGIVETLNKSEEIESDASTEPPVTRRSKKRSCPVSPKREKGTAKALHPFFNATAMSVINAKERPKRPRTVRLVTDPWAHDSATVHVNSAQPILPWTPSPRPLWAAAKGKLVSSVEWLEFRYHLSMHEAMECNAQDCLSEQTLSRREVLEVPDASSELWAEKYKMERKTDVISAAVTKDLVDWLRPWYVDAGDARDGTRDESDEDSYCSFLSEPDTADKERIAVITGPVGCGKSTIVANAARQLGLTILEINASVCRTGKRVRDIIGEALRTHRVMTNKSAVDISLKSKVSGCKQNLSSGTGAKTLILFEEVDELQDDEKGFWPSLQELAASSSCRRPIVCTANSFSSDMRELFVEPKGPLQYDLARLFTQSKVDCIADPVAYKHISFPIRSERQTIAVLSHVLSSEKVNISTDAKTCIALTCPSDTRKAINLVHFWGLQGLSTSATASFSRVGPLNGSTLPEINKTTLRGLDIVIGAARGDERPFLFRAGSSSFVETTFQSSKKKFRMSKRKQREQNPDAFVAWCTSLELMSFADTILQVAGEKAIQSSAEAIECIDVVYPDLDTQRVRDIAGELNSHALRLSGQYLSFNQDAGTLSQTAKDMQFDMSASCDAGSEFIGARRSIFSECIPVLRSMACREGTLLAAGSRANNTTKGRVIRRTRSSMRKGGFSGLDLNPSTVAELKRTSLNP